MGPADDDLGSRPERFAARRGDRQLRKHDASTWSRSDGTNIRIQAAFRPAGGSFAAPVTISAPGFDATKPDVDFDNSGKALITWQRFDGTKLRVQATTRSAGAGGDVRATSRRSPRAGRTPSSRRPSGPERRRQRRRSCGRAPTAPTCACSARARRDVVGFPRPKGATPAPHLAGAGVTTPCGVPNRTHGPALVFPSCNPPVDELELADRGHRGRQRGAVQHRTASVRYTVINGNVATEANEADVRIDRVDHRRADQPGADRLRRARSGREHDLQLTDNQNSDGGARAGHHGAVHVRVGRSTASRRPSTTTAVQCDSQDDGQRPRSRAWSSRAAARSGNIGQVMSRTPARTAPGYARLPADLRRRRRDDVPEAGHLRPLGTSTEATRTAVAAPRRRRRDLSWRRQRAILRPTARSAARSFFTSIPASRRPSLSYGSRRSSNRGDARLRRVQAPQLPDQQEPAQRSGSHRDAQVLPLVRASHPAQGNALSPLKHAQMARTRQKPSSARQATAQQQQQATPAATPPRRSRRRTRRSEAVAQAGRVPLEAGDDARGDRTPEPRSRLADDSIPGEAPGTRPPAANASDAAQGAREGARRERKPAAPSQRNGAPAAGPGRQLLHPGLGRAAAGAVAGPQPGDAGDGRRGRLLLPRRRVPRVLGLRLQQARQGNPLNR